MLQKMLRFIRALLCLAVAAGFFAGPDGRALPQDQPATTKEAVLTHHATGSFDVKMEPQKPDNAAAEAAGLGRMSIDKQFHGDLEATSKGEMLSVMNRDLGSGGYVAIEKVTGTLQGRTGSFVLQHNATMDRGKPLLQIVVLPDSGAGDLTGISGTLTIRIENGKHFYDLDYTLEPAPKS